VVREDDEEKVEEVRDISMTDDPRLYVYGWVHDGWIPPYGYLRSRYLPPGYSVKRNDP
jgi:hypothetical protein